MITYEDYRAALKNTFKTTDAEIVKEYWTMVYVEASAKGKTDADTNYNLGIKEFLQGALKDSEKTLNEL